MAATPEASLAPDESIEDIAVGDELSTSFLAYAMSVIISRALPDVRDGLKPVHRRILYSMYDTGLRPDKSYVKSARVVGDTMGRFHPHGDSAIYDAMVRMAQDFSMRLPLIDGHGNFGTHKDPAAAMRYTEARMDAAAVAMTEELSEHTVNFEDNYDGKLKEPVVLPAQFPNLLVNGSTGIAVGMATNMPPHNLNEVVAACKHALKNPQATPRDLMKHIPAPDFPTGGILIDSGGAEDAYLTGKGKFRVRAKVEIVDATARKKGILVTELPYAVGPEKVISSVKDAKDNKRLDHVSNIVDLSDRKHGLRLLIELKTGSDPQRVLRELYRYTPLEESFSVHNLALVDGQPKTLNLAELVHLYVNHRLDVTRRRCTYRRDKAAERAHLLEGYLLALASIDQIVDVIRSSKDTSDAREKLQSSFELSEVQAVAILEMPLRRLTSLEVEKITSELQQLREEIAQLEELLNDDGKMRKLVAEELDTVARQLGSPRRTVISNVTEEPLDDEPSSSGPGSNEPGSPTVVRLNLQGNLSAALAVPGKAAPGDALTSSCFVSTNDTVMVITSKGRGLRIPVWELPDATEGRQRGVPATQLLPLESSEQPVAVIPTASGNLILWTRKGVVKAVDSANLPKKDTGDVITLKDGDEVAWAGWVASKDIDTVAVTSGGKLLRTPLSAIPDKGAKAGGVAGMKVDDGHIVGAGLCAEDAVVWTLSDKGAVKFTPLSEYPTKGRGGGGVRVQRFTKDETQLTAVCVAQPGQALGVAGKTLVPLPQDAARRDGAGTLVEGIENVGYRVSD